MGVGRVLIVVCWPISNGRTSGSESLKSGKYIAPPYIKEVLTSSSSLHIMKDALLAWGVFPCSFLRQIEHALNSQIWFDQAAFNEPFCTLLGQAVMEHPSKVGPFRRFIKLLDCRIVFSPHVESCTIPVVVVRIKLAKCFAYVLYCLCHRIGAPLDRPIETMPLFFLICKGCPSPVVIYAKYIPPLRKSYLRFNVPDLDFDFLSKTHCTDRLIDLSVRWVQPIQQHGRRIPSMSSDTTLLT